MRLFFNAMLRVKQVLRSIFFDGVNERIVSDNGWLIPNLDWTISFWIKRLSASSSLIFGFSAGSRSFIRIGFETNGRVQFRAREAGIIPIITSPNDTCVVGEWYFVLLKRDAITGVFELYVNDVSMGQSIVVSTANFTKTTFNLGAVGGNYTNCNISNFSEFDKEFTNAECTEIWNNGKPMNLLQHSRVSNLVVWWKLNQNDTPASVNGILDTSGNSNTGTAENMSNDNIVDDYPDI